MIATDVQLQGYFNTIRSVALKWGEGSGYLSPDTDEYKAVAAFLDIFEITVTNINDMANVSRQVLEAQGNTGGAI
jgi:hypothetical protein